MKLNSTLLNVKKYVLEELKDIPECQCCKEDTISKLLIHHLKYTPDSVKYTSFPNSETGRIQYYSTLCNEVYDNPCNLKVMCYDCHEEMEGYIREFKNAELEKLSDIEERVPRNLLGMFFLTLESQMYIGLSDLPKSYQILAEQFKRFV